MNNKNKDNIKSYTHRRSPSRVNTVPHPNMRSAKELPLKRPNRDRIILLGILSLLVVMLIAFMVYIIDRAYSSNGQRENSTDGMTTAPLSDNLTDDNITAYPVSFAEYNNNTDSFSDKASFTNGILIDLDANCVLSSKNAEKRIFPASLTKIMTLIVAVENCGDIDDTFTMTADIIDPLLIENASVAGFADGETVTVNDMLYGLILPSGADAALGLAEYIAGGEEEFADLMNKKAAELGLTKTHFVNCTGLHSDDHYSTCHEMALMLEYAVMDPFMKDILSTYKYTTSSTDQNPDGIELTSTMFSRMYGDEPEFAFVVGGKTGYTLEANHCLASFAVKCRENEDEASIYSRKPNYILVTVGSTDKWGPVFDAIDIYTKYASINK